MSIATPQELLDLLLEDRPLTAVELESFISSFEKEGQLFDYKDGILTGKPADAKKMRSFRVFRGVSGWPTGGSLPGRGKPTNGSGKATDQRVGFPPPLESRVTATGADGGFGGRDSTASHLCRDSC